MQAQLALANAIDIVRKRIQQIRDRKEVIGEQNTKAALIDPILTALSHGTCRRLTRFGVNTGASPRTTPSITLCS